LEYKKFIEMEEEDIEVQEERVGQVMQEALSS